LNTNDASVAGHPATLSSSFTPVGTPPNGSETSAAAAAARARSGSTNDTALISLASMAASTASSSSAGERSPDRKASTSEQASPNHGVSVMGWEYARTAPLASAAVDATEWLGLQPTHNPMRWILPVTPGISAGGQFLFGGCGLGAAIAALEGSSGRPVVWAAAQYLSYAPPPSIVDIDVTIAVAGKQITQARAVGHVGDREILTVNAALGHRELDAAGTWATMPDVPRPDECDRRLSRFPERESIMDRIDVRLANARGWDEIDGNPSPDGRSALWARLPDVLDMSAATLGILGDYVPFGIGQALGRLGGGNSLDNTLRMGTLVPTEWVLLDIRVHAVVNGFGHGVVHLWAEDGTLLAMASQSTIVRFWQEEPTLPADKQ
jgi:acyl-CoA thioesterase